MMNVATYSNELVEREGIYFSKNESKISYPEDGNESYFQIEENSFWFLHRNNCIAQAVRKFCPDAIFFDIGGGNGYVARGLEENGITTVLVEPGLQGCFNARKRNLKHIVCSTLENASFRENSLPAIGLFDVVEHIEDDLAFLKDVKQYLTDNGLVFITVPAFNALWSDEDDIAGHYRRYTRKGLKKKLESVGFKVEYSTYIFSILIVPVFLFRALPARFGKRKSHNLHEKHKKEHERRSGFVNGILNWVWNIELSRIKKGNVIPIGGSCFIVARKMK